jgi:hypothetical protein
MHWLQKRRFLPGVQQQQGTATVATAVTSSAKLQAGNVASVTNASAVSGSTTTGNDSKS